MLYNITYISLTVWLRASKYLSEWRNILVEFFETGFPVLFTHFQRCHLNFWAFELVASKHDKQRKTEPTYSLFKASFETRSWAFSARSELNSARRDWIFSFADWFVAFSLAIWAFNLSNSPWSAFFSRDSFFRSSIVLKGLFSRDLYGLYHGIPVYNILMYKKVKFRIKVWWITYLVCSSIIFDCLPDFSW